MFIYEEKHKLNVYRVSSEDLDNHSIHMNFFYNLFFKVLVKCTFNGGTKISQVL